MYYVYILYSEKIDRYYIGYSADPEKRLFERHNRGLVKARRSGSPYILGSKKAFEIETEARQEEVRIKKKKSHKYLEWLIEGNW